MSRIDSLLRMVAPFVRPIYGGAGVILMFHRVLPKESRPRIRGHAALEVSPEVLERTIHYFAQKNYQVYSPDDLYRFLTEDVKKAQKPFVLFTFDDGYVDNLTYAFPIFKKHNLPFTINVSTCFPEQTAIIWWYLLEDLILDSEHLAFEYEGNIYDFNCAAEQDKSQTYAVIRKLFKFANVQQREQLTRSVLLANHVDLLRKVEEAALTWSQLKQLAADPLVTLSAHTVNHYVLSSLREEEVRFEISESKRILEDKLDRETNHFAYPFGNRHEAEAREFRIAADCGFKTAMTTRAGNIFPFHSSHLLMLPRHDLAPLPLPSDLDLVASGALSMRLNRFKRTNTT